MSGGGAYWDLIAILSNSARIAEQDEARLDATPTDCPKCGTVLKASRGGVRFCPWDGWKSTDGYHIES